MPTIRPSQSFWSVLVAAAVLGVGGGFLLTNDRAFQAEAAGSPLVALQQQIAQLQQHQAGQDAVIEDLHVRVTLLEEYLFGEEDDDDGGDDDMGDVDMDGDGFTPNQGDCDDSDPDRGPGAVEIIGDEIDNDCDGTIDEEF